MASAGGHWIKSPYGAGDDLVFVPAVSPVNVGGFVGAGYQQGQFSAHALESGSWVVKWNGDASPKWNSGVPMTSFPSSGGNPQQQALAYMEGVNQRFASKESLTGDRVKTFIDSQGNVKIQSDAVAGKIVKAEKLQALQKQADQIVAGKTATAAPPVKATTSKLSPLVPSGPKMVNTAPGKVTTAYARQQFLKSNPQSEKTMTKKFTYQSGVKDRFGFVEKDTDWKGGPRKWALDEKNSAWVWKPSGTSATSKGVVAIKATKYEVAYFKYLSGILKGGTEVSFTPFPEGG